MNSVTFYSGSDGMMVVWGAVIFVALILIFCWIVKYSPWFRKKKWFFQAGVNWSDACLFCVLNSVQKLKSYWKDFKYVLWYNFSV